MEGWRKERMQEKERETLLTMEENLGRDRQNKTGLFGKQTTGDMINIISMKPAYI